MNEISEKVEALREAFRRGKTRPLRWRMGQLKAMKAMLKEHESAFVDALKQDLGKSNFESQVGEIQFTLGEIFHTPTQTDAEPRPSA